MVAKSVGLAPGNLAAAYGAALDQGELTRYRQRRWAEAGAWAGWLSPEELPALTAPQALTLYRASGGNRSKVFAANPIAEIRDTLDFLLYDTITLEARFNECVSEGGAYKLDGAGKEFVSYLLCLGQSRLLAVWNPAAERSLRCLGRYPGTLSKGHWGLRYLDLLDALQRVRTQYGLADYREVDQFCYFLSRHARKNRAEK